MTKITHFRRIINTEWVIKILATNLIKSINTDISSRQEPQQRDGASTTLDKQQPGAEDGETPIEVVAAQPGDSVSIPHDGEGVGIP